jgi:uncharacterized protein YndB with AHSA1/START domain
VARIEDSIEINRRPEEVFAYVTDPSRIGEWQESVVTSRMEGTGRRAWARGRASRAGSVRSSER